VQGVEQAVAQITAAVTAAGSLLPAKAAVAAAEAKVTGAQDAASATQEFTQAAADALRCQIGRLTAASEGLDTVLEQQREPGGPAKRPAPPAAGSGAAQIALSTMEQLSMQAQVNLQVAMQQLQQAQQELKTLEAQHPCAGGDLLALMAQMTLTSAEGCTVEGREEATTAGVAAQAQPVAATGEDSVMETAAAPDKTPVASLRVACLDGTTFSVVLPEEGAGTVQEAKLVVGQVLSYLQIARAE
jgi:hypothetical protein